jgi:hypothetical protein
MTGAKKRLCNLNTLKRETYRLSPFYVPLFIAAKLQRKTGHPII